MASLTPTTPELPAFARTAIWLGPAATVLAILGVHVANAALRPETYVDAPPSISRAIVHADVGEPFAIVMWVTAAVILVAILTVIGAYRRLCGDDRRVKALLAVILCSELLAVVGMVTLATFRTEDWQAWHDAGSYLLFFGHTTGIALAGLLCGAFGLRQRPQAQGTLDWAPRGASIVLVMGVVYGVLYFGASGLTGQAFFLQRLALAIWEVLLISAFVGFLWRHAAFVRVMGTHAAQSEARGRPDGIRQV
jgi:hypothetical protein